MKRTTTILIAICVSALFANGKQISQNAALSAARKYSELDKSRPQKICEATRQTTLHTMLSISSRAMSSSAAMTR